MLLLEREQLVEETVVLCVLDLRVVEDVVAVEVVVELLAELGRSIGRSFRFGGHRFDANDRAKVC